MLNVLFEIEEAMRTEVKLNGQLDRSLWKSLDINYHPPFVERLWTTVNGHRVYLHKIHPCEPKDALFHPHPWPSAVHVLSGIYEMGVGYGKGTEVPPVAARMISQEPFHYEMIDPDGWHYVRPIGNPVISIMVTGKPWDRESPGTDQKLGPLSEEKTDWLFKRVEYYCRHMLKPHPDRTPYGEPK